MAAQKNILIRDLSPRHAKKLEDLKKILREKTASQTVLRAIDSYEDMQTRYYEALERERELEKKLRLYTETFANIRFQVSCLPEEK